MFGVQQQLDFGDKPKPKGWPYPDCEAIQYYCMKHYTVCHIKCDKQLLCPVSSTL